MEIKKAEFITSAVKRDQYPQELLPCIALVGKSNVGKSSLINALTNNSKLARISSQPGKTRLVNFYKINDLFYLVDLPGYGFARASQKEQEKWGEMVDNFLNSGMNLAAMVHVVDIRHKPTAEDVQMMDWIKHFQIPVMVLANKADKLGKTRWKPQADQIRKHLELPPSIPVMPFSAQNKIGVDAFLDYMGSTVFKLLNYLD